MNPATEHTDTSALKEQLRAKLRALEAMTVTELREEHYRLVNRATKSRNKRWLVKKVFFRMQEIIEGRTLSDAARAKARELADGQSLRVHAPEARQLPNLGDGTEQPARPRDPRLPPVGTVLTREFGGKVHRVGVLEGGFRYEETEYKSLSAVARAIARTRWNGYAFFGLTRPYAEVTP